jgi:magnesium transporter
MINPLYLPELREMLATNDEAGLREFCMALHPARTAEFMEGLSPEEAWDVLQFADEAIRSEIFTFLPDEVQEEIVQSEDRQEMADLIAEMPPDDRVDLIKEVEPEIVEELMPLLPAEERRDIQRLSSYPEGTAGSVMTTEVAKLGENLTVGEAIEEIRRQAEEQETVYYLYVVDEGNHLRGLISARQLLSKMGKPETRITDLMETELIQVNATDDQEEVANKVAKYDLLAIPVVDQEHRMLGIITHDDIIDVVREEATEDAQKIGAVYPLEEGYLEIGLVTLSWKRGLWLMILFVAAILTALALRHYEGELDKWAFLVMFVPLVISSGGNSGSQSATLIITALTTGDVRLRDWGRVIGRELAMGLLLGGALGVCGFVAAWFLMPEEMTHGECLRVATVVLVTLVLVVIAGTMSGSVLPLLFKSLGLDPALMSNPFVAGIIDIAGIVIYINVAIFFLSVA